MDLFFKSKLSNDNAENINSSLRVFVNDKRGVVEVLLCFYWKTARSFSDKLILVAYFPEKGVKAGQKWRHNLWNGVESYVTSWVMKDFRSKWENLR